MAVLNKESRKQGGLKSKQKAHSKQAFGLDQAYWVWVTGAGLG
jgi:hypothetical protein